MKKCFLFVLLFSFCLNSFGQENKSRIVDIVMHRVELGETIVMISKKYLVNPTTIYNSNKFIIDGVNEGMMLQIPVVRKPGQEYATVQYQQPNLEGIPSTAIAAIEKKPINNDLEDEEKEEEVIETKQEPILVFTEPVKKEEPVAVVDSFDPNLESKKGAITRIEKDEEILDDNYIVQPRETLYSISKKYNIPMDVIMAENMDVLKNGIVAGIKIKLPGVKREDLLANAPPKVNGTEVKPIKETLVAVETSNLSTSTTSISNSVPVADTIVEGVINHTVSAKETLYSLAANFNVSVEQLVAFNKDIEKNGLKVGEVIKVPTIKNGVIVPATISDLKPITDLVPVKEFVPVADITINGIINHTISPKETLYSLATTFNVSVEQLVAFNKDIEKNGLKVGEIIKVPIVKDGEIVASTNSDSKPVETTKASNDVTINGIVNHTVTTKETLFSISKKFNVSVEDLTAFNSDTLKKGLEIGSVIKIPAPGTVIPKPVDVKPVVDIIKNGVTTHTVATNETMFSIAKKYNTSIEELNALNGDIVKSGISIGSIIKIPTSKKVKDSLELTKVADVISNGMITHTIGTGETLYSIAKTYNVSVEQINALNENLEKNGFSIGSTIKLPVVKVGAPVDPNGIIATLDRKIAEFVMPTRTTEKNEIIHKVSSGQTLFSIAKKYNVSIYDIRSLNENLLKSGLQIGQNIKIPVIKKEVPPTVTDDGIVVQTPGIEPTVKTDQGDALVEEFVVGDIIMTVQAGETIESIATKFDVSVDEIIKNNFGLIKDRTVKQGQVIKVPATKADSIQFSPETFD